MPPKKAEAAEGGATKFTWEGANENKLLLIIMGRHISTAEFEDVATAFPGATGGAIRNRIGILRAKQKKIYEELGWDLPGTTPGTAGTAKTPTSTKKTPAKRASDDSGEGEGLEAETPSKKKRAPRTPRKKKEVERKESGAEDEEERKEELGGGGGGGGGVKKEVEEEEV